MTASPHLVDDLEGALIRAATEDAAVLKRGDVPRALLVPPTVSGLIQMALVEWAMIAGLWAAMSLAPWWLDVPLMLLVAGRLHAFGVILHDAAHMPLRAKGPAVSLLEVLAGFPIATTLEAMRYHHIRHHRDSGMDTDPYFKRGIHERRLVWLAQSLRGVLLLPFWTLRAPFGVLALWIPRLRNPYGRVFLQDKSGQDLTHSPEVIACARAEIRQLSFQSVLALAIVRWPEVVGWYYVLPSIVTGALGSYRVVCEHRYLPTTDRRIETILETTRDHHLRAWERVFFAPRNIGFHVVHHLHPQVALEHLPALRAWYRERLGARYPGADA